MTRKSRQGVVLLVFLTLFSFWLSRRHQEHAPPPMNGLDPSLDYMLQNFELQIFDTKGVPLLNLRAPLLRNNPAVKLGTIRQPVIALKKRDANWSLVAESATMTEDRQHIHLFGHVNVERVETATGQRAQMDTSEIEVQVDAQTASTTKFVSITEGRNRLQARGLELDLKSGEFRLKHDVKARYEVE
jgi:lipopolysaccharide export system protein LptC